MLKEVATKMQNKVHICKDRSETFSQVALYDNSEILLCFALLGVSILPAPSSNQVWSPLGARDCQCAK